MYNYELMLEEESAVIEFAEKTGKIEEIQDYLRVLQENMRKMTIFKANLQYAKPETYFTYSSAFAQALHPILN